MTGAVGGETPFGARPALATLRERRGPAALDAEACGPAFGGLAAASLAVGSAPGFAIANRLALGPEAGGDQARRRSTMDRYSCQGRTKSIPAGRTANDGGLNKPACAMKTGKTAKKLTYCEIPVKWPVTP